MCGFSEVNDVNYMGKLFRYKDAVQDIWDFSTKYTGEKVTWRNVDLLRLNESLWSLKNLPCYFSGNFSCGIEDSTLLHSPRFPIQ